MKKLLKITALTVTAFSILGISMVSAADEATGKITVTYEPGTVSPTDATWVVSMPVSVTLNDSNVATGDDESAKATSIQSVGQNLTFTVYDKGATTHIGGEVIKITLLNGESDGKISMTSISGTAPTMALVTSTGTSYITNTEGGVGTLTNNSSNHSITLKAGIISSSDLVQKSDKSSVELTFKFKKQ